MRTTTRRIVAATLALAVAGISSSAWAKSDTYQAAQTCGLDLWKAYAYSYLTGKSRPNARSSDPVMVTSSSNAVKLNGGQFRYKVPAPPKMAVSVSLPYFASGAMETTIRGGSGSNASFFVCEYGLKKSAASWSSFSVGDLVVVDAYRVHLDSPLEKVKLNVKQNGSVRSGRVLLVAASGDKGFDSTLMMRGKATSGSYSDSSGGAAGGSGGASDDDGNKTRARAKGKPRRPSTKNRANTNRKRANKKRNRRRR